MLKNALFFEKSWKIRRSVGGSASKPPVGLRRLEAPPPDPQVVTFSLYLRVIFEHCSDFSAALKL